MARLDAWIGDEWWREKFAGRIWWDSECIDVS